MRSTVEAITNFFAPPHCACCGAETASSGFVCSACFTHLRPIQSPSCNRCAVPLPATAFAGPSSSCIDCRNNPPPWRHAQAAYVYDDWSRRLILPLKYADRTENALFIAQVMQRAGAEMLRDADWIIPVPLHRWRLLKRRYNQAALIAKKISEKPGTPSYMPDVIERTIPTKALARLTARQRAAVIHDAFIVSRRYRSIIQGKKIVICDDVLTTGSTVGACTRLLHACGAERVDVLVAARTAQALPANKNDGKAR